MATYILLLKWTAEGRRTAGMLSQRVDDMVESIEADLGISVSGTYATLGRYDQVVIAEANDDEAVVKMLIVVAERGFAETETLRAYSMEELSELT